MGIDEAVAVARLIAELGKVSGRKRLQKLVYLLSATGARDFRQRFSLHYFGPFSRELASEVDFLVEADLVREQAPDGDGAFSYSVTDDQRMKILELYGQEKAPWVRLAKELDAIETGKLEAMSTVSYLSKCGLSGDELRDEFTRIKPRLCPDFDDSLRRLEQLKCSTESDKGL